jgi:tetratricopeptide (TPR) repeat protein
MARETLARFPENLDVLVEYGWIATSGQRWDDALRRWGRVRALAPERPEGYLWATRALWSLGRFGEAEVMAADARRRFPGNADIEIERAWVAVQRGDWQAALDRWQQVLAVRPGHREAQTRSIQAMRALGRFAEAEAAAARALAGLPDDPDLLVEHIWAAADRDDWQVVASRLEAARENLLQAGVYQTTSDALEARKQTALGGIGTASPDAAPGETSITELMLAFEGIGERCDLGAVQRRYGTEPLSLLRFGFAPFDGLITALEERFAAIGTKEDTKFESHEDETILTSNRYGMHFHTFVSKSEMAVSILDGELKVWRLNTPERLEAFRDHQRQRLITLKNRLIEEFEKPQKILVYANDERPAEDDAETLFSALRRYGPCTLLYVRPADAAHPAGTVTAMGNGLYLGSYGGLTDFVGGAQPDFDMWRQLLQHAHRLARETRAGNDR